MSVIMWPEHWPSDACDVVAGWMARYSQVREALEAVVAWENYDAEYAGDVMQREHDADYAHARSVLAEHPPLYRDTSGKWTSE